MVLRGFGGIRKLLGGFRRLSWGIRKASSYFKMFPQVSRGSQAFNTAPREIIERFQGVSRGFQGASGGFRGVLMV